MYCRPKVRIYYKYYNLVYSGLPDNNNTISADI